MAEWGARRIEMVVPSLEIGGMEHMVCQLARGLRARGWHVGVTCTLVEGELAGPLRRSGVPVHRIPLGRLMPWFGYGALAGHLRTRAPNVVHSHSGIWWRAVIAGARAGVRARVHTVHGLHQNEPWFGVPEKRLSNWLTGAVVAVAPSLEHYLLDRVRVPIGRLHVVGNGVDTALHKPFRTTALRERLGIGSSAFVIGTVARLDPVKNLTLPIPALAWLVAQGLNAHFIVAGEGSERNRLVSEAEKAGIGGRVHLLGAVVDSHLVFPEFDVFVLPSRVENTSLSLLEAMSTGLPCVATAVGGNPAVLDHGAAGVLIPDQGEHEMRVALRSLANDPGLRQQLGEAARQRAVEQYSLDAMIMRYERIYLSLLEVPER